MFCGDRDTDAITCPYCGFREYPEVGFSFSHECAGTVRAEQEREAQRKKLRIERMQRNAEVESRAGFLSLSGLLSPHEAYWLAEDWLRDDEAGIEDDPRPY